MSTTPHLARSLTPAITWPLLTTPDGNGQWQWPTLPQSVADSLRSLLSVRPGELLGHADYAAGLQDFLHQPNTLATRARIQQRIEATVARFEPRAQLDRVDVREDESDPATVRIDLHYRLRRTGEAQQMSLSMGLAA